MFCQLTDCVDQFTGCGCETCPFFERTPENIKRVRDIKEYQAKKKASEEIEKERVDEEVERDNKRNKGFLTAEEFTNKVQDLMHLSDDYLFVDQISCEQANMWFYNKLVEKIKAHPKIWKWFFTV